MNHQGPLLAQGNTADIFAWGNDHILKLYRAGFPASDVAREAHHARIARDAGVNTPAAIDVVTVDERPGIIFERVNGPTMLDMMLSSPQQRTSLIQTLAALHAALHAQTVHDLPMLHDRMHDRIHHLLGAASRAGDEPSRFLHLLDSLPTGDALCHGDFHPHNILITDDGPIIIDWVDAARGHPQADVARTIVLVRYVILPDAMDRGLKRSFEELRTEFEEVYLARYRTVHPIDSALLERWIAVVAIARLTETISPQEKQILRVAATALADRLA